MTGKVTIKGLDELTRGARGLADRVEKSGDDVGRIVAGQVAAAARGSVPRLTGRLAASVTSRVQGHTVSMAMGEGVPYAGWIKFGGSRGRPLVPEGRYLVGPGEAAFDDYVRRLGDVLEREVDSYSWPRPT